MTAAGYDERMSAMEERLARMEAGMEWIVQKATQLVLTVESMGAVASQAGNIGPDGEEGGHDVD